MPELQLHPNMQLGVRISAAEPLGEAAALCSGYEEQTLLRRLGVRSCVVECSWAALEPEQGRFDEAALEAVRAQLIRLRTLDIEPLLCLWHGQDPLWFRQRGGWLREESVLFFAAYCARMVAALGHLAAEYVTFAEPNALLFTTRRWEERSFSAVCGAHLRCYRLIHEERRRRGFRDTAVGFSLHMRPPAEPRSPLRLPGLHESLLLYQELPLMAMARGEFMRPLRNITRAKPGQYCDFLGFSYGLQKSRRPLRRRSDDLGREIWPEGIGQCCAMLLKAAARPLYFLDRAACDWDDSFRARYIFEHLNTICSSHQPVLRYYYGALTDGREQELGLAAREGLFSRDPDSGEPRIKKSGEFYARLIANGRVSAEDYARYVAGQRYRIK